MKKRHLYDIIEAAEQIERDLDRTWPGHERLDRDALRRVLVAFARSVPEVGYCQGLNSLGATLLLVMAEEDAYWALVLLVTRQLEPGFYSRTLWRSRAEQEVLRSLVATLEPRFLRMRSQACRLTPAAFQTPRFHSLPCVGRSWYSYSLLLLTLWPRARRAAGWP